MVLTKNDTLALKGIAILLLLWHHMFFVSKDLLFDWHDIGIKSAILIAIYTIFLFVIIFYKYQLRHLKGKDI